MRTSKLLSLISFALLIASCSKNDIEMRTTIHRDGSCMRELNFTADSATLVGTPTGNSVLGHLLSDSVCKWDKCWHIQGDTICQPYPMTEKQYRTLQTTLGRRNIGDTVELYLSRSFPSIESMNNSAPFTLHGQILQPTISLTKHFKWFYTDYTFVENYPCQKELFAYPLDKYLEEDVASYWFTGEPNILQGESPSESKARLDAIEEQVNQWLTANWIVIICSAIEEFYDSIPNPPVDKAAFAALKDSIAAYAIEQHYSIDQNVSTLLSDFFHSHAYDSLLQDGSPCSQIAEEVVNNWLELFELDVDYLLVMPGRVLDTGNGILEEDGVRYRLNGSRLIPSPYSIAATSRATNIWAFVITALILLVALSTITLSLKVCHRRKKP